MEKKVVVAVLLCLAGWIPFSSCWAQSKDYRSQVLFIYNFIKYVNWPQEPDQFVIGVIGNSPIASELNKLAAFKKAPGGKQIAILQIENLSDARNCQIVYVSDHRSKDIALIIEAIQMEPALVVAERDGLAKKGAEINFFTQEDDKLGFSVNRKNCSNKKIKISGELLRMAELVE